MSKQVLDISQMRHLKELGLDTSKASMHYWIITNGEYSQEVGEYVFSEEPTCTILMLYPYEFTNDAAIRRVEDVPTFTLQDIIDLLPSTIEGCELEIHKVSVCYFDYESSRLLIYKVNQSLIDAAYEMLCWCVEKGYLPTNKL